MTNLVGEIRMFAGPFAPAGWAFCEGQQLPISEYDALYFLIGTTYGGDGEQTFALPNLSGRIPIHQGAGVGLTNRLLSETGGQPAVALTSSTIPPHRHSIRVEPADGASSSPGGNVLAADPVGLPYSRQRHPPGAMADGSLETTGLGTPHENRPPFLCVSFIIALFGAIPQRS